MKITLIGTGYVGLVSGACFAEIGHEVLCIDINKEKIENLQKGILPFHEAGLQEMVDFNVSKGRLHFSHSLIEGIDFGEVIFSAVGTPEDEDHRADLQYVRSVAKTFGEHIENHKILVNKSTVPIGTAAQCADIIKKELEKRKKNISFDVVSNPEFLREGAAIKDFLNPERIVCGVDSKKAEETMKHIYAPLVRSGRPLLFFSIPSAEVIKYASNSFLATKISFINEIAHFCEQSGADIQEVSTGIGMDSRIGNRFLHAGIGYGGSCLPKDIQAFIQTGNDFNAPFRILEAVDAINDRQRTHFLNKILETLGHISGKKIAIWGLSFKPRTDDMRESPALDVIRGLHEKKASITVYDPLSMENAKNLLPPEILYAKNKEESIKNAEAIVLCTEWDEFRGIDLNDLKKNMKENAVVFDGRNIFEPAEMTAAGVRYVAMGRHITPSVSS